MCRRTASIEGAEDTPYRVVETWCLLSFLIAAVCIYMKTSQLLGWNLNLSASVKYIHRRPAFWSTIFCCVCSWNPLASLIIESKTSRRASNNWVSGSRIRNANTMHALHGRQTSGLWLPPHGAIYTYSGLTTVNYNEVTCAAKNFRNRFASPSTTYHLKLPSGSGKAVRGLLHLHLAQDLWLYH